MRNAQKAALMAIFAAMEHDAQEQTQASEKTAQKSFEPALKRPIEVNLLALARGRVKTSA